MDDVTDYRFGVATTRKTLCNPASHETETLATESKRAASISPPPPPPKKKNSSRD